MEEYLVSVIAYLQTNRMVAGAIGLLLLYLLVRKTKLFLFMLLLSLVCGIAFMLIFNLADKGSASKRKMINQTGRQNIQ